MLCFVSELPKSKPVIVTDKDKYDPGDSLIANCTSPPSKPVASLKFFLNNMLVSTVMQNISLPTIYIS